MHEQGQADLARTIGSTRTDILLKQYGMQLKFSNHPPKPASDVSRQGNIVWLGPSLVVPSAYNDRNCSFLLGRKHGAPL